MNIQDEKMFDVYWSDQPPKIAADSKEKTSVNEKEHSRQRVSSRPSFFQQLNAKRHGAGSKSSRSSSTISTSGSNRSTKGLSIASNDNNLQPQELPAPSEPIELPASEKRGASPLERPANLEYRKDGILPHCRSIGRFMLGTIPFKY